MSVRPYTTTWSTFNGMIKCEASSIDLVCGGNSVSSMVGHYHRRWRRGTFFTRWWWFLSLFFLDQERNAQLTSSLLLFLIDLFRCLFIALSSAAVTTVEPFRLMLCWRSFYGHLSSCFDCCHCRELVLPTFYLSSFSSAAFMVFHLFSLLLFNSFLCECLI